MDETPGIDVSRWQGPIDWPQVAAAGYRFVAIRASVGDFLKDPFFKQNIDGASAAGLLVTAYHVHVPDRAATTQIDNFFSTLDSRKSDLPLVVDVERADGLNRSEITDSLRECLQLVADSDGRKPVIYTASWFWTANIKRSNRWKKYDLWIANYGVAAPNLPPDWDSWKFWQFSDRGSVPGVSANRTDLNKFNGTHEELQVYAGIDPGPSQPPAAFAQAIVEVVLLSYRNGPGMNFERLGDLSRDRILAINLLDGDDVWVEFEQEKWAAVTFRGSRFMELAGLKARVTAPAVSIRSAPKTDADDLGDLHAGDQLDVLDIDGKDVWVEFEPGLWAPLAFRGVKFMALVR